MSNYATCFAGPVISLEGLSQRDVIADLLIELRSYAHPRTEVLSKRAASFGDDWLDSSACCDFINGELFDAMDDLSPAGCFFGTSDDGCHLGYWDIDGFRSVASDFA